MSGAPDLAASTASVDPDAVWAAIKHQEWNGNGPAPDSPQGAIGSTQMLPETAESMARKIGVPWNPSLMRGDTPRSLAYQDRLGRAYFDEGLATNNGDPAAAAAYYFGGPDPKLHGPKTVQYVQQVMARATGGQGGSDDLPDAQAVMKAYGWDGGGAVPQPVGAVAAKPLPNVPGYIDDPNYTPPADGTPGAWQTPAIPIGGPGSLPDPNDVAKAYGWKTPQDQTAPATQDPSLWGDIKSATGGAWDQLTGDFKADMARHDAYLKNPVSAYQPRNALRDFLAPADMVGDAATLAMAPAAGAIHALVVRPGANALDAIPLPAYSSPQWSVDGSGVHIAPGHVMSPTERHAANEDTMNLALSAARAPDAPVAAVVKPPNALTDMSRRFTQAGVTPFPAAAGGEGTAAWANTIAENPVAGVMVRKRLQNALTQTHSAANDLAAQYGDPRGPQITGENIQQGVQDFARNRDNPQSFSAKAGAAYDDVFSKLDSAMAGKTSAPVKTPVYGEGMLSGTQLGQTVTGGSQITTPATTDVLNSIANSAQSKPIASLVTDPTIAKAAQALQSAQGAGDISFSDLRRLRTWVRDAQSNPELRQNIGSANLQRLEGALTSDIYSNAETLGSPQLTQQLRRTDQFYAAGQNRIQTALQPFADAKSGENAYSRVIQAAGSTSSADAQKLLSLKRSLSADDWGDVAANAVNELGKPSPGSAPAGEGGFSVNTFVTNYNKLSPRGKEVLFGSLGGGGAQASQLRASLDNLASVASDLKGIQKGANTSKTFVNAQTAGTMAGLINPHTTIPTALGLGGMALTGEMLTNPSVVGWLTKLSGASRSGPGAVSVVVKQLGNAARGNAALAPLYQQSMKLLPSPAQMPPISAAASQPQQPAQ